MLHIDLVPCGVPDQVTRFNKFPGVFRADPNSQFRCIHESKIGSTEGYVDAEFTKPIYLKRVVQVLNETWEEIEGYPFTLAVFAMSRGGHQASGGVQSDGGHGFGHWQYPGFQKNRDNTHGV